MKFWLFINVFIVSDNDNNDSDERSSDDNGMLMPEILVKNKPFPKLLRCEVILKNLYVTMYIAKWHSIT